ncbi:MAG TPA: hypothetical protein DCL75_12935 [Ktedonobacter sp.]|nr:hypothetical protein [Ktedonobacter sp.]
MIPTSTPLRAWQSKSMPLPSARVPISSPSRTCQNSTFVVNNPGTFGTIISVPIINQPHAGILSMDSVVKRPSSYRRRRHSSAFHDVPVPLLRSSHPGWRRCRGLLASRSHKIAKLQ